MKIWLVMCGEYSDYHFRGAFSSREKADEFINACSGLESPEIIETVVDEISDAMKEGRLLWRVEMGLHTGMITELRKLDPARWTSDTWLRMSSQEIVFQIWAEDAEHAVKIASEKRRQYLAEETTNA